MRLFLRPLASLPLLMALSLPVFAHEAPEPPAQLAQNPHQSEPQTEDPAAESRLLGNSRQLILSGKRSGEGYFSADGGSYSRDQVYAHAVEQFKRAMKGAIKAGLYPMDAAPASQAMPTCQRW